MISTNKIDFYVRAIRLSLQNIAKPQKNSIALHRALRQHPSSLLAAPRSREFAEAPRLRRAEASAEKGPLNWSNRPIN